MNNIEWTTKALRQTRKLPAVEQGNIADAVETLRDWPNVEQVKALQGKPGYRLRVGRYRVLFTVHAGIPLVVRIEEVKKRDEHTY
ncbi:Plasmid stabilization system [uncultured delta proteobacterium]|uniref:Plasmid stabilization system n=1 Tax=uncultured delta proteobacterium TaxID=34034 RepID=A0A212J2C5_9DELT|nr:Plasmid stabilization system [uncultured delta proteobacterium]